MTGQTYNGANGNRYTIGREVGRGGEGRVCEVKENVSLVVKLYTEPLTRDKAEKLRYMVAMGDAELLKFAAWPVDIVTDAAQQVCGFVMKKLDGYVPLHMLFTPMDRKNIFPDKGYNFLVHVARNLAIAFHKIHAAGLIIGDINEGNILVNGQGMIVLIDCDSFQVQDGNNYYFCEVGIPRYTPPELLKHSTFSNVVRTKNTDTFSLAILIFQLLFLGRHPFTGRNLTTEDIDEEKAIKTFEFAYSLRRANKKLNPAKNSFELQSLSDSIIELFHNAFENIAERPQPKDWVEELGALSKDLKTCAHSRLHYYPGKLSECPWCAFRNKTGTLYFLDDSYQMDNTILNDIDTFIQGYRVEKIEVKGFPADHAVPGMMAVPIDKRFARLKTFNRSWYGLLLIITIGLFSLTPMAAIIGVMFIVTFYFRSPTTKQLKVELQIRQNTYNTLKQQFEYFIRQAEYSAEVDAYDEALGRMTTTMEKFMALPATLTARTKEVEEQHYEEHYKRYLHNIDISRYTIPSIGPVKKDAMRNRGIRTAADLYKLPTVKVPGIGPKNIQILLDWQRQVGSGFIYTPDLMTMKRDIAIATYEIAQARRTIEEDIKQEYFKLQLLRSNIHAHEFSQELQYDQLKRNLCQADLDLQAFRKYSKLFL